MSASVSEAAFWTCDCIFWNKGKTERVRWRQNVRFKQRNGRLRQRDHHLPGIACLGRRLLAPSRQDSEARVRFRAWPRHGRATKGGAKWATGGGQSPAARGAWGLPPQQNVKDHREKYGGTTGRANDRSHTILHGGQKVQQADPRLADRRCRAVLLRPRQWQFPAPSAAALQGKE